MAFHGVMPDPAPKPRGADALRLETCMKAIARDRDRAAFIEVFRYFAPRLKAYLMRLGSGPQEAEELMQEVLIIVWQKAQSFDAKQAGVSTWIFTIARNKRIDALRRERRPEIDPNDPALVPAADPPADDTLAAMQQQGRLREALKVLPPEQIELVRLAYFEDKAHVAIAEEKNLPLGTVKSRLRLALGHLRKALKETS